ncbi:MAG: ABC transporter permease subunit [Planctomycetes bacterium]|nr:ABC transporter permease subunit [Planctomycetota bacterium]
MLLGPIFSVELTTSGRRVRFVLLRMLYVAVLLLAMWIGYTAWIEAALGRTSTLQQASFARFFFQILAWVQVSAILLVGPALAAGTIAQERERRTLDYLLSSDLGSGEIVLGKFAARVLQTAYLLLAGLPVLALTRLMGGIDAEEVLLVFLISLSSMLTVAAIGIAISVRSRKAREAVSSVYLILFAWLGWPLLLYVTRMSGLLPISVFGRWFDVMNWLLSAPNPLVALWLVLYPPPAVAGVGGPWWAVAMLMLMQSLISAGCLAGAVWGIRRVHRRFAGAADKQRDWRFRWRWTRPIGDRPMLWKELYAERISAKSNLAARVAAGLIVSGIVGATVWNYWNLWLIGGNYEPFVTYVAMIGMIVACAGLLLIGSRAAGLITSEKERDCWVSLLSTTLTAREIVDAKVLGNLYAARGVYALLVFLWVMAVLVHPPFLVAAVPLAVTIGGTSLFATSLGLLISLRAKSTLRSMGATMGLMIFIGGGYMACVAPFVFASNGDDVFILTLSGLVPFLLVFPGIVCVEGWPGGNEGPLMVSAYTLGTIGYWVAGCILWQQAVEQFDHWSGRLRAWRYWDGPPPEAGESPIAPKPVEVASS